MSAESRFLTLLRLLAHDPAAQGLMDDVALLPVGDTRLVLTSDTIVEGVHYLPADPAGILTVSPPSRGMAWRSSASPSPSRKAASHASSPESA